jgi:outer membrane lipoprotein SlyB
MHTPLTHKGPTHHPMMIIAAIAVVLFCLAGTAAIMGWIPTSIGGNTPNRGDLTEADRLALASKMQNPAPAQQLVAQPVQQPLAPVEQPLRQPVQQNTNYVPAPQPVQREAGYRPQQVAAAAPAKNWCSNCGNVESVREIHTRAQGSGVGVAGGAILGGLLGNQVGGGNGRSLATVAGAVGGAVVGNQVEGNMKATTSYEIRVRLDDGTARTFHQQRAPGWRTGDRVRVVKGVLHSVR